MKHIKSFILLCFLLLAMPAAAFTFEGKVVRVKDGDSILVHRPDVGRTSEIRLAGIDAPEIGQPWGIQARTALRQMIGGKMVRVEVTDRDMYNRLVGKVWTGKLYVNAEMTRRGHAWAYARYLPDPDIRAGHDTARNADIGLWSLPKEKQLPPATWRARNPRGGG